MARILITGFTPFAGRTVNASWLAAHWLAEHHQTGHRVRAALLPVIWGAPGLMLETLIRSEQPDLVISLGEGHPERFAIETRARNLRRPREDNNGQLPVSPLIAAHGHDQYESAIDAGAICNTLLAKGYPAQPSDDAGAFLCEETLYCLERLRETHAPTLQAVFCHLPPFGTDLHVAGRHVSCDQTLLAMFSRDLLSAVTEAVCLPGP